MTLIGRVAECAEIDRLLDATRQGLSGALVLRGEPGIGKTALVDHAAESADGFRVVRIVGIESEIELGFAALHQLLVPFLGRIDKLPPPQALALGCAFGLAEGEVPSRFLIGLASLTLLSEAAGAQPLLCILDDSQWLDQESAEALAFVARRLYADRIAMLFTVREPSPRAGMLEGFPELVLTGLAETEARELLEATASALPDEAVARRILAETNGNPLALVELGADLAPDPHAGEVLLPEPLPLTGRLEARYLRQVRALPDDTRMLLLMAAAEPSGDLALLWRGAELLGLDVDGDVPDFGGLLHFGHQAEFRHPLIRSAVYYGADELHRRRVHETLAAACDAERDADRRAWHRAAAVDLDEDVAVDLELASGRAQQRGGYAAAAAFLIRAAQVTPDEKQRAIRLLAAASVECTAGAPTRAQALLDEARPELRDDFDLAHALRIQGEIRYALGQALETTGLMLDAARALHPFDQHAAREMLLYAVTAARVAGQFGTETTLQDVARAALVLPVLDGSDPTVGDLLLDGLATLEIDGLAAAELHLRRALVALQKGEHSTADAMGWLVFGGWAAAALGDFETWYALASRAVQLAQHHGALVMLTRALHNLAIAELLNGSLSGAEESFAAGRNLVTSQANLVDLGGLMVLAARGQETIRADAELMLREASARGHGWIAGYVQYAMTTLELSLGNYGEALLHAQGALREDSYLLTAVLLADVVEAGVRSNHQSAAEAALARYSEIAAVSKTPLSLGLLARSRALLAGDDQAEALYEEAIEHLQQMRGVGHVARARLLYGEWLRRQKRRTDARVQLRTAREQFEAMGARSFAERAHRELAATGEGGPRKSVNTATDLTPQESQVARLAAEGATNREIAATMFISAATVEYHLRKVFRKLDVTSRRQLRSALAGVTV